MPSGSAAVKLKKRDLVAQFVKYIATGLTATGIEYLAFFILYQQTGMWYITSNSVAMTAGFLVSFFLNKYWSFKSRSDIYRQFMLYSLLFIINLGISNGMMYMLSDLLYIIPSISKVMVMVLVAGWNFIIYKKIIYRS